MMRAAALLLLLVAPCAAVTRRTPLPPLGTVNLATIPVHLYRQDCHKRVIAPTVLAAAQAKRRAATGTVAKVPGAGMEPEEITPYAMVLKDGYFEAECVKDSMYEFGDKFGDGKFSYKMGDISNVSIVHYESLVPKEDREPMSHDVCFKFCRTVPDMHFFGLFNGRDCYCTPYYDAMESDSSQCDAVCEGNPTQMCGGKHKSSVFSMHSCADTAEQMASTKQKALDVEGVLSPLASTVSGFGTTMQGIADQLQPVFGQSGDPAASDLLQTAKVFAGELEKAGAKGTGVAGDITAVAGDVDAMGGDVDFAEFENAQKAENLTKTLEKLTADAEDATEELEEIAKLANASADSEAAAQYYPIMYFVNKEFNETIQTCTGKVIKKPMIAKNTDACAQACDNEVQTCVGYAFFAGGQQEEGESGNLCFLMEKFTEVTYYTGCEGEQLNQPHQQGGKFLQKASAAKKQGPPIEATCMAKLSNFVDMNISPDASGKCTTCLKKATEAKRCPGAAPQQP